MKMKQILFIALGLYVVSTGATYAGFTALGGAQDPALVSPTEVVEESEGNTDVLAIDPGAPKDQVCPLNGGMYTQVEKEAWSKRRPLAVMIENSPDARPQSGLSRADIVFEALAEGGVTRFMAMYYCDAIRNDVVLAPVRSARTYYIDWASGFNKPLYVHVGGANLAGPTDALGQLTQYGWTGQNDLNQFSIGYPTFKRDYNRIQGKQVATEHTMVSSTELLWKYAETRDWTNTDPRGDEWSDGYTGWETAEGTPGKGDKNTIAYDFWDGFSQFSVKWEYDKGANEYKRIMAGEPHKDLEPDIQIAVKNVVVMFMNGKVVNELKHMLYSTTPKGKALIIQNGEVIEGNWNKAKRESEITFTDAKGKTIPFVKGKTWISVLTPDTQVTY